MSKYKPFDCQNSQTIIVKFHIKELGKTFLVEDEARENHIKSVVGGYVVLILQIRFSRAYVFDPLKSKVISSIYFCQKKF